jgi:protein tyrosine phosphatase (PTP) superfamily phosphohydrolase (DUF442 family)
MNHPVAIRRRVMVAVVVCVATAVGAVSWWKNSDEKRVRVIIPGQLIRGGWQTPKALHRIIRRERIKTIVTLTAINTTDPKYINQAKVVAETGVRWQIVPMHGSRATMEQMAQAADLLADPARQPVFFHCVAGHHRTSLAHAAYLIRHEGWSASAAWREVSSLPWARPDALTDQNDQALIYQFSSVHQNLSSQALAVSPEVLDDDEVQLAPNREMGRSAARGGDDLASFIRDLESGESQLRPGAARPNLSFRPDARGGTGSRDAR